MNGDLDPTNPNYENPGFNPVEDLTDSDDSTSHPPGGVAVGSEEEASSFEPEEDPHPDHE
jgi:hypothetical protein